MLRDLHYAQVRGHPETLPISTVAQARQLRSDLALRLSSNGEGAAGVATSEPPLYYLLEIVPYSLGSAGSLLDQLELMRILSALMGALTALFVFLFIREALPAVRWAWPVGALSVALFPLLGFMSGAVNPDSMLFAVSAANFYCLARGFRHGLTRRLALAIGALVAVGLLTKVNFVGLAPGVILGLIVLSFRAWRSCGRAAVLSFGLALTVAASPLIVFANLLSNHAGLGVDSGALRGTREQAAPIFDELSYIWQFYLPRLPGMINYFPDLSTTYQVWLKRSIGLYGWLDTSFPLWVYEIAPFPVGLIALLSARMLVVGRAKLRQRLVEMIVYATMIVGLAALVGAIGYISRGTTGAGYAQPRYLLPLVPILAALVTLAARGAGRKWGPAVGTLIVVLLLAHDIFSQLLVVSRFYG